MAATKTHGFDDSDYEYGYDYLYEDGSQALNEDFPDPDDDDDISAGEKALFEILPPLPPPKKENERQKLKRELRAEAMRRMEKAARTPRDFNMLVSMWDKLDQNRERRERYHEILCDDSMREYAAASTHETQVFPEWKNTPMERQLAHGNFLDWLFDCPYEMHDLTAKNYIRKTVMAMKEDHKELLYFLGLKLLTPQEVAVLREQTDRNIRKVRDVAVRKVQKKLYSALKKLMANGYDATRQERRFIARYEAETEGKEYEKPV